MTAIDPISRLLEAAERATRPWPGAEFAGVVPGATADDVTFLARSTPEVVASLARVFVAAKALSAKQTEVHPMGLTQMRNTYRRRQEDLYAAVAAAEKVLDPA